MVWSSYLNFDSSLRFISYLCVPNFKVMSAVTSGLESENYCKFSARFLVFSNKISTVQKIVLFSSRGQGNFRGPKASRPRT